MLQLPARRLKRSSALSLTILFSPSATAHSEGIPPSTVVEAFELSTERRARERQELEQLASEKEALRAMMEEQQRREEVQKEREEIARLRQEQVTLF